MRARPGSAAGFGSCGAARSIRFLAGPVAPTTGCCRSRRRRSPAGASAGADPAGIGARRRSSPALSPRAGLPPRTQSEGSLPEEDPCSRPPPSTSSPCPVWFFRLHSPFFRGSEAPIQEGFAPIQLLALIQLAEKRAPDSEPDLLLLSVSQAPPAGRRVRELVRQILQAGAAAQNPQNAFQHLPVGFDSPYWVELTAAVAVFLLSSYCWAVGGL